LSVQLRAFYDVCDDPQRWIVEDSAAFERLISWLKSRRAIVVDYETSGLAWYHKSRICGVGLGAWEDDGAFRAAYVPIRHRTAQPQLPVDVVVRGVGELLADPEITKIGHNLKFEDHLSRVDGMRICGPRVDTLVAAHLYNENIPVQLERRARDDLGIADAYDNSKRVTEQIARLARDNGLSREQYRTRFGYSELDTHFCGGYCCGDLIYTAGLASLYLRWGVQEHFPRIWRTEMRLTEVLCDTECAGLRVDTQYLSSLRDTVRAMRDVLGKHLWQATGGYEFNPGSDDDVRRLLVEVLQLPLTKQTEKGALAVDREVLSQFSDIHHVCRLLLQWREADKLATTYTDSVLKRLDEQGFLYADLQQMGTATGRLSCREPNFQNFPVDSNDRAIAHSGKRLKEGGVDPWSIRRAFLVREPGWSRIFLDYSQIELRILAHYSRDPIMVEAFLQNSDVHERTAQAVEAILGYKPERRIAKIVNFGLSYGMSPSGLSRQAKISFAEATRFLDAFFQQYRGVADYRYAVVQQAIEQGCQWRNVFGRCRRITGLESPREGERNAAVRQMIASAIQGTAAELTKESLVRISDWLRHENLPAMLCNTVHDEIQLDVPNEYVPRVIAGCRRCMEDFPEFHPIPVIVDAEVSTLSWADKQPYLMEGANERARS
jgi:DNA polymerase-1